MAYLSSAMYFIGMADSFDVEVLRVRRGWKIFARGVPEVEVEVGRIGEVESAARAAIAASRGTAPEEVAVQICCIYASGAGDVAAAVEQAHQLRAAADRMDTQAALCVAELAKKLSTANIPVRDIGELLRLSPQRISQIVNAPLDGAEPDTSLWAARARWDWGSHLSEVQLARISGMNVSAFAALWDAGPGSRYPLMAEPRNWPASDTFRFIMNHLPARTGLIPRLFPRVPDPRPAAFVSAERATVPGIGDFAVHVWRPGDDAGDIAVAYASWDADMHLGKSEEASAYILKRLDGVSAVAVWNGEARSVRVYRPGIDEHPELTNANQPLLAVAEHDPIYLEDPAGSLTPNVSRYWWTDLANLLRVDVPWWPRNLADVGSILAWRPGDKLQSIVPRSAKADPQAITAMASVAAPEPVRAALDTLARLCLHRVADDQGEDYQVRPGLIAAAISAVDPRGPEPKLGVTEQAAILHHRTTRAQCEAMLAATGHLDFMPVLTEPINLHKSQAGELARSWINRLVEAPADRHDEAGYWWLQGAIRDDDGEPIRWLMDPASPNTWILETAAGKLYSTVGTRTPRATGILTAAEIYPGAAFFADSAGMVWPIPDTGFSYYATGYRGSGPQRLTETINQLLKDARADVHEPDGFDPQSGLYKLFSTRKAPYRVPEKLLVPSGGND